MTRKTTFFESFWFKFNNSGLALGMIFKFYTSVAKGLKLKVRKKFYVLSLTFVEVTGEELVEGPFWSPFLLSWIGSIDLKMRKQTENYYNNYFQEGIPFVTLSNWITNIYHFWKGKGLISFSNFYGTTFKLIKKLILHY